MEDVQVSLPSDLLQRLRREIPSDEALSQVVAEAVHMWLEQRREQTCERQQGLHTLRESGMVMDRAKQRDFADAMMPRYGAEGPPDREQVEMALSRLKVPLSEEIIAMRREGHCLRYHP